MLAMLLPKHALVSFDFVAAKLFALHLDRLISAITSAVDFAIPVIAGCPPLNERCHRLRRCFDTVAELLPSCILSCCLRHDKKEYSEHVAGNLTGRLMSAMGRKPTLDLTHEGSPD
jgi:hypothetical protein